MNRAGSFLSNYLFRIADNSRGTTSGLLTFVADETNKNMWQIESRCLVALATSPPSVLTSDSDRRNFAIEAARPAAHACLDVRGTARQALRRDHHAPRPPSRNNFF